MGASWGGAEVKNSERRQYRGTDGWRAGMLDAIAVAKSKQLQFYNASYLAGVQAVLSLLEAELQNNGPLTSSTDV